MKNVTSKSAREDPSNKNVQTPWRVSTTKPPEDCCPDDCNFNYVSRLETVEEEVEDVTRRTSFGLTLTPVSRWV